MTRFRHSRLSPQARAGVTARSLAASDGLCHVFSTAAGGWPAGAPHGSFLPAGLARAAGFPLQAPLIRLQQVHGAAVHVARAAPSSPHHHPPCADGCVSGRAGLVLVVQTADCVPVLLVDLQAGVIGAAHMGWRGALAGILQATVSAMVRLGASPNRIQAALGPAIRSCCFSVREDVAASFRRLDPGLVSREDNETRVDLPAAARHLLVRAGLCEEAVEQLAICTYCHPDRYPSFRREGRRAGRLLAAIYLKPEEDARDTQPASFSSMV
ncbi:MAG: peptidoglycan editing factor PgeF [Acidobacteriota bacterium]